jgi:hypothetical protein
MSRSISKQSLVILTSCLLLLGVLVPIATFAKSATPSAVPSCGAVLVPGGSWLGGQGLDVRSNGPNRGTPLPCGPWTQYGADWQCVELANRLYTIKGWGRVYAANNAAMYIPEGSPWLQFHLNGSGYMPVPGDLIIEGIPGVTSGTGHVSVAASTITAVEQNANPSGWHMYMLSGSTITGGHYQVRGIEHAPGNNFVPSTSVSHPSAIEKSNGDVNVFYPAADTHRTLHMAYWSATNGWNDYPTGQWTQASPSAVEAMISTPKNMAGTVRVYYTDAADGNLHELSWNPASGSWSVSNTGRWATGSPSAVVDPHGIVHVYYSDRGTNPASLEEYYLDSSGWHSNDFGHRYQIVGDPYAIVKQNEDVNVFYHNASDNTLHMAYLNSSGGSWADYKSGQVITNSPTAVEATISTSKNVAGTVRAYYSGNDTYHSMNELSWTPNAHGMRNEIVEPGNVRSK